jgi:hypothetical protein
MTRIDVYTAVHKMQRARLFELTVATGKADSADAPTIAKLGNSVYALTDELTRHAEHEERFIHPVLRSKAPHLAVALDAAHVQLDRQLEVLRQTASRQAVGGEDPNALYRALASFTAIYLGHLAVEENEALPALWERCSDDELFGIMTSFKSSLSSVENLTSVIAQLPALSPAELTHLVSVGIDTSELPSLAQLLATTLNPLQLGTLPHVGLKETAGDQS